jgi:sensor domain CHASE-containing protein/anti-sigma regulatory factor (Ser/Thr protein kinase)
MAMNLARRKSLRAQIVVIVTLVVAVYAGLDHVFQRMTIAPSFAALEREEAQEDLGRVLGAIRREAEHLDMRCRDWATWDDTYRFVQAPFDDYVRSNLDTQSFADGNVNLIYVCDTEGRVVWGRILDLETRQPLEMAHLPRERLVANHEFLVHTDAPRGNPDLDPGHAWDGSVWGLTLTEHGPLLVSCRPILPSDGRGEVRGTVIMGRLLSDAVVASLSRRTAVGFDRWSLGIDALPPSEAEVVDEVTASVRPVVREVDDETLHVYGVYPDLKSNAAVLLRANVDRAISARGATAVRYALISTVSAGVLLLLVLLGVLQRTVLAPIERLTGLAVEIGRTDDSGVRLGLEREDEIGILAREFDSMLEKLTLSRAAVVKAARSAGMSEIATGILHNVGNVLNSVNVSATMVSDRVRNSKIAKLTRLSEMVEQQGERLGDFILNNPKGRHVGPYLSEVSRLMTVEREAVLDELSNLNRGIEHIRQLVNSQQDFAGQNELREPTDVAALLDHALVLAEQASPEGGTIAVVREYEHLPRVWVDRHKLTEILVNLMTNARQAMERARVSTPTLCVSLTREGERLEIRVEDNGSGISAENLPRVFNHGFTTKRDGHGFGLHSAANAAVEMQGRLTAESPGEGAGSTFTLELPFETTSSPS